MKRIFKIPVRILINEDYNEGYKKYAKQLSAYRW